MNRNNFFSIRSLITFFGLLFSAPMPAQVDKPKPFNDTLIPVHDPVIVRQDSTYYIICTGQGITQPAYRTGRPNVGIPGTI